MEINADEKEESGFTVIGVRKRATIIFCILLGVIWLLNRRISSKELSKSEEKKIHFSTFLQVSVKMAMKVVISHSCAFK